MAVTLRLNRLGTTKRPFYRLIAIDSRAPRNGRHLEVLGTYDPRNLGVAKDSKDKQDKGLLNLKSERIQYWLSKGATTSATVNSILKRAKISSKTKTAA